MLVNAKNLSEQALSILVLGKGYRSNDQSVWFEPDNPKKILAYEINELGNEDIPNFLAENYELNDKTNITLIDKCIKKRLNSANYKLIWLCSSAKEAEKYADSSRSVYEFLLPENPQDYILVSDLGAKGCLIAYTKI